MVQVTDEELKALAEAQKRYASRVSKYTDSGLVAALQTREGRAVIWWLLDLAGVFNQPYSSDDRRTAFNCGELNIGLQLQARLMSLNPDGFVNMMKEVAHERSSLPARYDDDTDSADDTNNPSGTSGQ